LTPKQGSTAQPPSMQPSPVLQAAPPHRQLPSEESHDMPAGQTTPMQAAVPWQVWLLGSQSSPAAQGAAPHLQTPSAGSQAWPLVQAGVEAQALETQAWSVALQVSVELQTTPFWPLPPAPPVAPSSPPHLQTPSVGSQAWAVAQVTPEHLLPHEQDCVTSAKPITLPNKRLLRKPATRKPGAVRRCAFNSSLSSCKS
jgi:hypothetical protein